MSNYTRVIPRDLFNESKLLKCIGRLSLLIHDGKIPNCSKLSISFEDGCNGFEVMQDKDNGSISLVNISILVRGIKSWFYTPVNDKSAYPLFYIDKDQEHIRVFDEDGEFTNEFKVLIS